MLATPSVWQILCIGLSVLSVALMVSGLAAPLWIWLDDGDEYVGIGLFFRVGFERDGSAAVPDGFEKVAFDSDDTLEADHWYGIVVMECLSTVMSLGLFPLLYIIHDRVTFNLDNYFIYRAALVVSVLAWAFNCVGLVVFLIYHGDILREGPSIGNGGSFSWGGFMCGLALLLQLALSVIIFKFLMKKEEKSPQKQPNHNLKTFPYTPSHPSSQNLAALYPPDNQSAFGDRSNEFKAFNDRRFGDMVPRRDFPGVSSRTAAPPVPPRPYGSRNDPEDNIYYQDGLDNQSGYDNDGFSQAVGPAPQRRRPNVLDRSPQQDDWHRADDDEVIFNNPLQNSTPEPRSSLFNELDEAHAARNARLIENFRGLGKGGPGLNNPVQDVPKPFNTDLLYRPF